MKAVAVFPESQQVKLIEQDVPRLSQPDQVLLRLLDVGICGTDKEICSFEYGTPPPGDDHLVVGHESLAEIVQVGSAVERLEWEISSCPRYAAPARVAAACPAVPGTRTTATPASSPSAASRKPTAS